ncbi:hypothetical protein CHH28_16700 [Bacterioplanes sanyensis]|uniref:Solute-binding protein family 3/N-terminal domain-containing protein n=1 Tax=Bacterioplanes sanyensis TaxID=1249553 RepID=A0A222FNX5_9GAMM|nr:transporter substrate-binding domain-containing protein [Bacterioplanes sanyensis]ASP40214.1 hypothetical protein CHH28_16700 [Bacterioplanes sanyensis]
MLACCVLGLWWCPLLWADDLQTDTLKIASEEWRGYTNEDGSGLYWDIIRSALAGSALRPEFLTMPWKRAEMLVLNGDVDAIAGVYDEPDRFTIPRWHLMLEDPVALLAAPSVQLTVLLTLEQLAGRRISWIRGYDYHRTLLQGITVELLEVSQRVQAVRLVASERADFMIDYEAFIRQAANEQSIDLDAGYQIHILAPGKKLYLTFQKSEQGRRWAQQFDAGMEKLVQSGEIDRIYRKWAISHSNFGADEFQ